MLSPFRFYELYNAMSLHWKPGSSYDFYKYGGKTRVNENSFLATKGKWFYEKNARKFHNEESAVAYLAANFKAGCKWVTDLTDKPYTDFIAYRDSMYYRFQQDLEKYSSEITPYNEFVSGSSDSWIYMILLNEASNGFIFDQYNKKYKDDIMWEEFHTKLKTFYPFVVNCFSIDQTTKKDLRAIVKKVRSQIA